MTAHPKATGRVRPGLGATTLHLIALSALVVAQPIYSTLQKGAELFVARGTTTFELVMFAVVVAALPPLAAVAVVGAAWALDARVGRVVAAALVWLMVTLFAMQAVTSLPLWAALAVAVSLASGVVYLYQRFREVRDFLGLLSIAPIAVLLLFLLTGPVSKFVLPQSSPEVFGVAVPTRNPVIFWILDELPTVSLLGQDNLIDRERFPNFARLADMSIWFRGASADTPGTTTSVSSIVSGVEVDFDVLPRSSEVPNTLFTLLAGSHEMHVVEPFTDLCSDLVCGAAPQAERRTSHEVWGLVRTGYETYRRIVAPQLFTEAIITPGDPFGVFGGAADRETFIEDQPQRVGDAVQADKREVFHESIDSIEPGEAQLYYQHFFFPHLPFHYLPSLVSYNRQQQVIEGIEDTPDGVSWVEDEWFAIDEYQRHLLQVQALDTLLGELLDRLDAIGMLDPSLLVFTSDHGVSHRPGNPRRNVTAITKDDIGWVPLFVKAPFQLEGVIDDNPVQGVDVLPTIADMLGANIPWPIDGRSALDEELPARENATIRNWDDESFTLDPSGRAAAVQRKFDLFGPSGGDYDLFAFGPFADLAGTPIAELPAAPSDLVADIDDADLYIDVAPASGFVPAFVGGSLSGDVAQAPYVAVAINGVIGAVPPIFEVEGEAARFGATIPDRLFVAGANTISLVGIAADGSGYSAIAVAGPS